MRFWLTEAALLLLLALALRRGGQPEKWIAIAITVAFFLDTALHVILGPAGFRTFDPLTFVTDAGICGVELWVALRANRWWPLCATALQLIVLIGHLAEALQISGLPQVYWGMTTLPLYLQLGVLLAGIYAHARRVATRGPYPDWRLD
jgi:hypothetical protein